MKKKIYQQYNITIENNPLLQNGKKEERTKKNRREIRITVF